MPGTPCMGVRDPILKKYENWYAKLRDFEVPNTIQFFRCELRAIASLRGTVARMASRIRRRASPRERELERLERRQRLELELQLR